MQLHCRVHAVHIQIMLATLNCAARSCMHLGAVGFLAAPEANMA
jgi:hypothetical protein